MKKKLALFTIVAFGMSLQAGLAEAGATPQSLFTELDSNSDGKVTLGEIPEGKKTHFNRLLKIADKDGNGVLTKVEFREGLAEPESKMLDKRGLGSGKKGQGKKGKKGNPLEFFKRFDKNKDGKISKEELPEKLQERLARVFERAGKDTITIKELIRLREKRKGKENPAQKKPGQKNNGSKKGNGKKRGAFQERFKTHDKDGNGTLSKEEAPKPFQKNFNRIDANSNGELSQKEVIEYFRKMRGQNGKRKKGKRPAKKN